MSKTYPTEQVATLDPEPHKDGQSWLARWTDPYGKVRTVLAHIGSAEKIVGRKFAPGLPITLAINATSGEATKVLAERPFVPTPAQQVQATLLATVLAGRVEQLEARQGDSMTAMILPAEIVSTGKQPKNNIMRVKVPGEERARLARFEPGQLENVVVAPGLAIDAEVQLVPSERIEVARIAARGALGSYDTVARRIGETEELEDIEAAPLADLPPGLRYVAHDPDYVAPDALKEYAVSMEKLSRRGIRVMGELIGPAGCGKTSWAYDFAANTRRPFAKFDMGTIVSPDQLLGYREFRDGRTEYVVSQLVQALATPRACIFLDEINRISPSNSGPLFPLLDHTGEVWSDYLQTRVTVHPSVVIFGASNRGASFTGTYIMDEALESRFQFPIEVSYPEPKAEASILERRTGVPAQVARALVEFAGEIRKLADPDRNDALERSISTRACIAVGHLVASGMQPGEAVKRSVLPRYSSEGGANSPRSTVAKVLQGKFAK